MKKIPIFHLLTGAFLLGIWSCSSAPRTVKPYYEMPPDHVLKGERDLFARALQQQKSNKMESSIDLWKRFLANNPRSFRGYNNLGMAHYSNDQLSEALSAFETGLALEPLDPKIKENLKRTLRFQVTLLRENKDYDSAIEFLKRISELSVEPEREKVALEIETLEDKIFEQVKRSNTLEDYEAFIVRYPNSPRNSDEARRIIASMKPQQAPVVDIPSMKESVSPPVMEAEPFVPESMETPKSSMPGTVISEDTIEIVAEPKEEKPMEEEFPELEPPMEPEPALIEGPKTVAKEMKKEMTEKTEVKPEMEEPSSPKKVAAAKPVKKVKITTKTTPLRVRADPSSKAQIVAQIPTKAIVPMFQETGQWYQVEYQPGKKGWISKKYSKLVN